MRLTTLEQWLSDHGWQLDRIRGSHRSYRHTESGHRVTLAIHGGRGEVEPPVLRRFLRDVDARTQG